MDSGTEPADEITSKSQKKINRNNTTKKTRNINDNSCNENHTVNNNNNQSETKKLKRINDTIANLVDRVRSDPLSVSSPPRMHQLSLSILEKVTDKEDQGLLKYIPGQHQEYVLKGQQHTAQTHIIPEKNNKAEPPKAPKVSNKRMLMPPKLVLKDFLKDNEIVSTPKHADIHTSKKRNHNDLSPEDNYALENENKIHKASNINNVSCNMALDYEYETASKQIETYDPSEEYEIINSCKRVNNSILNIIGKEDEIRTSYLNKLNNNSNILDLIKNLDNLDYENIKKINMNLDQGTAQQSAGNIVVDQHDTDDEMHTTELYKIVIKPAKPDFQSIDLPKLLDLISEFVDPKLVCHDYGVRQSKDRTLFTISTRNADDWKRLSVADNWQNVEFVGKKVEIISTSNMGRSHYAALITRDLWSDEEIHLEKRHKAKVVAQRAGVLKLQFEDVNTRDSAIKRGKITLGTRVFTIKPWQNKIGILQCFKCSKVGHIAKRCTSKKELCMKCGSENHKKETCNTKPEKYQCPNCVTCNNHSPEDRTRCNYLIKAMTDNSAKQTNKFKTIDKNPWSNDMMTEVSSCKRLEDLENRLRIVEENGANNKREISKIEYDVQKLAQDTANYLGRAVKLNLLLRVARFTDEEIAVYIKDNMPDMYDFIIQDNVKEQYLKLTKPKV
jgi:hypothetical protein